MIPSALLKGAGMLRGWRAYLFAVIAISATLSLRVILSAQLEGQPTLVIFTPAIMVSAYLGGLWPGLFATFLACLFGGYHLLRPFQSFAIAGSADRWQLFFMILSGVVMSLLNEALHRGRIGVSIAQQEQRHADAATRESEERLERFRALLEATPDAMVIVGADGLITLVNTQAEKLFGYSREELLGQRVDVLAPTGFQGKYPPEEVTDLLARRKDGSQFPVDVTRSPLQAAEGLLIMSSWRDISERHTFEAMLSQKNRELETANQAKDDFLAHMSHELRTPLNAIIGFTGTLLMRLPGPLTSDQEKQLTTVQSSARHLLALINDLLDVERIGAGKVDLFFEVIDCRTVAEEVAATLAPQAHQKGHDFKLNLPPTAVLIKTDRRALTQIVLNLASNAIKFTEKGAVEITVSECEIDQKRCIQIDVSDTGRGIRLEDQKRLFEPFSQIETAKNTTNEGSGLGLHLSRKLAQLLGGRLTFKSDHGKGSVFTLVLVEGEA